MIEPGSADLNRRGIRRSGHISGRRPDVRGLPVREDVRREVELHLDCRAQELIDEGWEPDDAQEEAERLFGNRKNIRRECEQITKEKDRMTRFALFLQGVLTDIRYALRTLRHTPVFTSAAVVSLAIGIGAGTAIFSIVNAVMLRPLPYHEPERLVRVWPTHRFSKSLFEEFRNDCREFEALSAYASRSFALTGTGQATDVTGGYVTVSHFSLLGIQPFLGRGFTPDEEEPGSAETVVLSYGLWQEQFGADPEILGTAIDLSGSGVNTRTVIGIMPEGYEPLDESWKYWIPMKIDPANFPDYAGTAGYDCIGRITSGSTPARAEADVRRVAARVGEDQSWITPEDVAAASAPLLLEAVIGSAKTYLVLFLAAVGLVLLLTCANLANIMLARAGGRRPEMAVRTALGAGRSRLLRQLITESVVLGLLGGGAGLVVGTWLLAILRGNLPPGTPRVAGIGIDTTVLLFTAGLSLLAAVLYGLAPALSSTRNSIGSVLREGQSGTGGSRPKLRWNAILITAEITVSVILLIGAGLLIRSSAALRQVDPGFEIENLATIRVNPPGSAYPDDADLIAYYRDVTTRLTNLPEVTSVGRVGYMPLTRAGMGILYEPEGHPTPEGQQMPRTKVNIVSAEFFETMGIPLLAGRVPDWRPGDPPLIEFAVNRAFADLYWEGTDAVGRWVDMNTVRWTITGIVGNLNQYSLRSEPVPEVYVRDELYAQRTMYLLVRTAGDPAAMLPLIQETIRAQDPDVPLSYPRTMEELRRRSVTQSRTSTVLMAFFGIVAFALALIGVFGVVSYTTQQRTREIGIRITLGAVRPRIVSEVLAGALLPVGIGLLLGIGLALFATRALANLLFGVAATDLATYAGVVGLQIAVALLACYLPARRIASTDPMLVLRSE